MNKKLLYVLAVIMTVCMIAVSMALTASAASASLWFTDPTVTVGNNVSVVVDVKGDNIGGHQMNITYDTSYLQFVSATGSTNWFSGKDNGGVINVSDMANSGSVSKMSFTLTFKTKKTGTTKLTPSGYKFFDGGGDEIAYGAIGYSEIKIKPVPEASSDATLKGLTISNGTLTPAFSPNTTNYTATVDFSISSIAVTALKNHNGASVYVSGNDSLEEGDNAVTITVTAENGAKKIYTIKVTRGKNPLSTGVFLTLGEGLSAEVAKTINESDVPKGFNVVTIKLNGVEVNAIKYDENAKAAVYLLGNDKVKSGFYYVNETDLTAESFEYLGQVQSSLTYLDINLVEAPEGYEVGVFKIGDKDRNVLVPKGAEVPNHCLVYAIGAMGQKMLYMYDPVEGTFQRYSFAEMGKAEEETTVPVTDETTDAPAKETQPKETSPKDTEEQKDNTSSNDIFKWIFVGVAALIVVLIAVALVLNSKYN